MFVAWATRLGPTLLLVAVAGVGSQAGQDSPIAAPDPQAQAILAAAEALRNPEMSFTAAIALRSTREDAGEFVSMYAMKALDRERALIIATAPEHYRGRILLRAGRQYYLHLRSVKNPLRVAPQQGFRGDVANADIARVDYTTDYVPVLAGEEMIDGKPCYVLDLSAQATDVAYRRLRYWIEKDGRRPLKSEHYAISGRILKTVYYEDYRPSLGEERPHRMRIIDGIDTSRTTTIEYTDLRRETFPDRIFNPSYLSRLEEMGDE